MRRFNQLRVKEQCRLVGDQELELPVSSVYPSHVTTEHHCMLSHRKRKEKKNQATAMAWKS